jgi:hypothetical protein
MWNVRGTSTAMPNWLAHGATYALRIYAMRADWDGLTHSNQNVTPHSAIVTFTLPSCNPPTTTTVAPTPCADGGTCIVGDTGPGGGIIFYVHPSGGTFACGSALTSTCRYLEAAPNGWSADSTLDDGCTIPGSSTLDPSCAWSGVGGTAIGSTARGTAIGTGFSNTQAAVGQAGGGDTANRAISIAWEYTRNGKSDWNLPSQGELNELCKYARTQTTGDSSVDCDGSGTLRTGFATTIGYWSSTEAGASVAWRQRIFSDGSKDTGTKSPNDYRVRPVRAFGGTLGCADGGTCVVGDTGPGGGIVFYVAGANFTSTGSDCGTACRYLEAAPNFWGNSSTADDACATPGTATDDPACVWSGVTGTEIGATARGTAVGTGYANTQAAVGQAGGGNTAGRAITAAWDYTNNSKSDWHLPSQDELNELCKYSRTQTTGDTSVQCNNSGSQRTGFSGGYWGSNEVTELNSWQQGFASGSRGQSAKTNSWKVRPVRAFG